MIIGLTGGIGSGKTTVINFFKKFDDVAIYIADAEAKKLMNSSTIIKEKIIHTFGKKAYNKNILNKKYIAEIVFNDKEKLEVLNKIVHPEVKKDFLNFYKKNNNKRFVIYESALLFESKSSNFCNKIICVTAPITERIKRVMRRDSITKQDVLKRISNQLKQSIIELQSNYCITNTNLDVTKERVYSVYKNLTI